MAKKVLATFGNQFNQPGIDVEINEADAIVMAPQHFTIINFNCQHTTIK